MSSARNFGHHPAQIVMAAPMAATTAPMAAMAAPMAASSCSGLLGDKVRANHRISDHVLSQLSEKLQLQKDVEMSQAGGP